MRYVKPALLLVLILLSLAAGVAKVMQLPDEVGFFQQLGMDTYWVIGFGIVQVVAAVLLLPAKTRRSGAVLAGVAFLGSALMILLTGQLLFAATSVLPVILAAIVFRQSLLPVGE